MYHVEIYVRVRRACMVEGMSVREASRVFGLHRDTVRKMLAYSAPPGYRRQDPPRRPRLEPYTGVIPVTLSAQQVRVSKQAFGLHTSTVDQWLAALRRIREEVHCHAMRTRNQIVKH